MALLPSNATVCDFKFKQIDCILWKFWRQFEGSYDYISTTMIEEWGPFHFKNYNYKRSMRCDTLGSLFKLKKKKSYD